MKVDEWSKIKNNESDPRKLENMFFCIELLFGSQMLLGLKLVPGESGGAVEIK